MLNLAPSGGFNVAGSRSSHRSKAITSGGKARGCFPLLLQRVMLPSERKHSEVSVSNFFAHRAFRSQSTILSQPVVFKLAGVAVRHCQLPVRVPLLLREPRASRMHDQKCRREAQARRVLHRHRSASLLAVAADSSFFEIPPLILKIKVYVVCVLSSELMDHFFQFPIRVTCCPGPTRPSPTPSATASTRSRSIRQCWTTTCPGNSRCRSLEPSTCSISRASLTVQSFW